MKGYCEATRKKPQTVGEFLKKASERNYASDQIYKHNMKEGTTKLKMVKDTIHYQNGGGWTAFNMLHDPIMEMNALEAIRMVTPARSHSIYPSLAQIYSVRRADERAILQNHENLNREVFLTPELKTKLLKYKKESVDMYETDSHWPSDENYDTVLDKEHAEIQWLEMFRGSQNDFFNSEYVRGFGLVFQYNPPANQGQNQPLPLPQAPNHNPDEEDEEMLQELRAQLELIKQELANKDTELHAKEVIIEERDQTIADLTEQNTELTNTVTERDGTIDDLNDATQNLREANAVNQSPQINELTHRLELVTVQKEALEQTLGLRNEEIASLRQDKIELQQDKTELRADKQALAVEKTILIQEKIKLAGDITTFVAEIEEKDHRIEELSTQCQDYVGIMGACPQCMDAI